MATISLAAQQLTCNDVLRRAHIFATAFRHFCNFKAPLVYYCKELSAILCLGFTAALLLVEDAYKDKHHLNVHLQYRDFANSGVALSKLQKSHAEVIRLELNLFRSIINPLNITMHLPC